MGLTRRLYDFLLVMVLLAAGCATPTTEPPKPRVPDASSVAYLRPGDNLIVTLQGVPDPSSNPVQIDEQGLISLPYIGPVNTAGTTTASLSQRVRETYIAKSIYNQVDVGVAVTERYVYVGGEVVRPGRIVWTPDLTVAKAVQAAGGFTLYAKEAKVSLVRDRTAYQINVKAAEHSPSDDPKLLPGDSIQVPKSAF